MEQFVSRRMVAARIGVCVRTLERWEKQGIGPAPVRVGPRLVRYRAAEVEAWLAGSEVVTEASTGE